MTTQNKKNKKKKKIIITSWWNYKKDILTWCYALQYVTDVNSIISIWSLLLSLWLVDRAWRPSEVSRCHFSINPGPLTSIPTWIIRWTRCQLDFFKYLNILRITERIYFKQFRARLKIKSEISGVWDGRWDSYLL